MRKSFLSILILLLSSSLFAQRSEADLIKTPKGVLTVQPIAHSTMVLSWNDKTIYIDPTGGAKPFEGLNTPDVILITDIHGDHMSSETLAALNLSKASIVVPRAVAEKLPETFRKKLVVIGNGEKITQSGFEIKAVPMYNLPERPDERHVKGRGNGYIINIDGKNIYISGDTEDIPEMRALKNIDVAFICMNLPYTMDIKQAASAVLEFKPKIVYPFHYRGSDIEAFKILVNEADKNIDVRLKDWYPN